jgi:methionine sulfoxide reductase heme-binding subunit
MSSSVLWYTSQATGLVCLVLFTAVVVLGVAVRTRQRLPGLPRFGTVALHRSISLLALAFLAVHIATSVADTYVDISPLSAILPFISAYQPLWIGLGAVAVDLMLAVAVTSLLRDRIGRRAWRALHWLAYAAWPIAVLHGFGLGGGDGSVMGGWELWLTGGCVLAVAAAVAWRLADRRREPTPEGVLRAADTERTPEPVGAGIRGGRL